MIKEQFDETGKKNCFSVGFVCLVGCFFFFSPHWRIKKYSEQINRSWWKSSNHTYKEESISCLESTETDIKIFFRTVCGMEIVAALRKEEND